jgi:hypothetical protein
MNNNCLILRLNRGDELISSLIKYCEEKKIVSAWIWGIGAVSYVELSAYDLEHKKYIDNKIKDDLEISSLSGNIGLLDNKLVAHLHAVVSDWKTNSFGGHLNKATVSATCELIINPIEFKIVRKHDKEIGLNLIS